MAHSSSNSNYKVVPEAADALNKFKYEVASEVGVKNIFKLVVEALPIANNLCNGANATLYSFDFCH